MIPIPSYSQIADLIKKGATLEAQEQIMQLREAAIELQEENLALREELKGFREQKSLRDRLSFAGGLYWLDNKTDGPFCQVCYDHDQKLIRLQNLRNREQTDGWRCLQCENWFQ